MFDKLPFIAPKFSAVLQSPILLSLFLLFAVLFFLYRKGFPKPIPGIPYNQQALESFLGDLPAVQQAQTQDSKGFTVWLRDLAHKHKSPLVQIFLGPFVAPCLVLYDYRESYDIVTRRTKDFDRDQGSASRMGTVMPAHFISMVSADSRYKGARELVKDLMTPSFLNEVSALEIHNKAMPLIELWRLKIKWSDGHPFEAQTDLQNAAMDIIMAAALGDTSAGNVVQKHVFQEKAYKPVVVPKLPTEPVIFETIALPSEYHAMIDLAHFMGQMFASPLPKQQAWIMKNFTKTGDVFAAKDRFIKGQIQKAIAALGDSKLDGKVTRSALDFILQREVAAAEKAGRKPVLGSRSLEDELLGYVLGGYETSSTTLSWMVKCLSDNQEQQSKLRNHLQRMYPNAMSEQRQPSATELTKIEAPYLDAFVEECMRLAPTASLIIRQALRDTTILGHFVPKGSNVFMHTQGTSFVQPAMAIDDKLRSTSSQKAKLVPEWPSNDVTKFRPERWLVPKSQASSPEEDEYAFNSQAGPLMSFGGGPRGCFGKRLAYMELKMVLALLVWNFKFKPCAGILASYKLREGVTVGPEYCYVNLEKVEY